ncbi:nitrate reductase-like protein [Blastomyces silverae]|uniref:Nitrate reductase-like protein n=1 Tax=Blastomyces silverae TaxID=2060906 RepID=A0A0H1B8B4_9EURO|nr:nitrate reductase-like protein [Blastomyces silverae]
MRLGGKSDEGIWASRWVSINHPDRLKYPLIRRDGKLRRASWDEAMSLIVEKAKEVQARLTKPWHWVLYLWTAVPGGILRPCNGWQGWFEYIAHAVKTKLSISQTGMEIPVYVHTATAAACMRESFGCDGQPASYSDIDYTDCLLMVGHNVAHTQTVLWARILDRLDGPNPPALIVVDPRKSETATRATVHLAAESGTNLAPLNGLQHLLFENDWIDGEFVSKHVVGIDGLRKVGVYQSNQTTASTCQINNINLLLGKIGRPGSGILQMNGQPTAQNNRETGCDGEFPGFRNFQHPKHMQEIADIWNIDTIKMPHWNQPTHIQNMLSCIENGSIEMLWISGTNPLKLQLFQMWFSPQLNGKRRLDASPMQPASMAIWDEQFVEVVLFAQSGIQRQKAWAAQHIKVKSPQTLLAPMVKQGGLHMPESSMAGQIHERKK